MTEKKNKKSEATSSLLRSYISSLLGLVLCVCMFCGTSYAWFTSEVTVENNEIHVGMLDVDLLLNDQSLKNSSTKIYDNSILWEPGYTALRTLQVQNKGNLAFRYTLKFTNPEGSVTDETAKWFDVWCYHDDNNTVPAPTSYAQITDENGWEKIGSLAEVLDGEIVFRGSMTKDDVVDLKDTTHTYTIALHMNGETVEQEDPQVDPQKALNDLMGKSISLNVKLEATQLSSEADSFNGNYDLEAFAGTLAVVNELGEQTVSKYTWGIGGAAETQPLELDTEFQFLPTETLTEALKTPYKKYIADFVVSADKDVPGNSMALAGYYQAWCSVVNHDNWVALTTPDDITAGTEIRLIDTMGSGFAVTYEMLCEYGNDGVGFLCGAADLTGENKGTTITVELRLYEVVNNGNGNEETEKYITVGKYTHKFE